MAKTTQDKILDLIAREAERAYRRGFQQGQVIGPHLDEVAVYRWRYERPLTKAPTPETGRTFAGWETPRDRLLCECSEIEREVERILNPTRQIERAVA